MESSSGLESGEQQAKITGQGVGVSSSNLDVCVWLCECINGRSDVCRRHTGCICDQVGFEWSERMEQTWQGQRGDAIMPMPYL